MARALGLLALAGLLAIAGVVVAGCHADTRPAAEPNFAPPPTAVSSRSVALPPLPAPDAQAAEGTKKADDPAAEPDEEIAGLIEIAGDATLPPKQRANACAALGKLGPKAAVGTKVVAAFLESLSAQTNSDWRDRATAALALGQLGDPDGLPSLTRVARKDADHDVRKAAVAALAALAANCKDTDARKKAEVQLRLVAQTDTDDDVRKRAADEAARLNPAK